MLIDVIFLVFGFFILLKGADLLVAGASSLAQRLRVSPLVIGLTIVAFGTSSPEMVVSVFSSLKGANDLVLGNVIGSNIFNIGFIIALSSIIRPLAIKSNTVWKEIPMAFLGVLALIFLGFDFLERKELIKSLFSNKKEVIGLLTWGDGGILLLFFGIFLYYTLAVAKREGGGEKFDRFSVRRSLLMIFLGMIGLIFGSRLVVDEAITIARQLKISEKVIGLTLISIGTSLPELMTNLVASFKRQTDIAVGNVVGSNIFNIFFILGLVSLINPVALINNDMIHILVLVFFTLFLFLTFFIFHKKHFDRFEGAVAFLLYLGYLVFLFLTKA